MSFSFQLHPPPPHTPPQSPFARKRLLDACMHTGRILLYQVIMTRLKNLYSDAPGGLMLSLLIWVQQSPPAGQKRRAVCAEHATLTSASFLKGNFSTLKTTIFIPTKCRNKLVLLLYLCLHVMQYSVRKHSPHIVLSPLCSFTKGTGRHERLNTS